MLNRLKGYSNRTCHDRPNVMFLLGEQNESSFNGIECMDAAKAECDSVMMSICSQLTLERTKQQLTCFLKDVLREQKKKFCQL